MSEARRPRRWPRVSTTIGFSNTIVLGVSQNHEECRSAFAWAFAPSADRLGELLRATNCC